MKARLLTITENQIIAEITDYDVVVGTVRVRVDEYGFVDEDNMPEDWADWTVLDHIEECATHAANEARDETKHEILCSILDEFCRRTDPAPPCTACSGTRRNTQSRSTASPTNSSKTT